MLNKTVTYFKDIPASDFTHLLLFIVAAWLLSIMIEFTKPILQKLEKGGWLPGIGKMQMTSKHAALTLLTLGAATISLAGDYVQSGALSLGGLGSHTAEIAAIAVAIYHFGGSSTYGRLRKDLQYVAQNGKLPTNP